MRGGVVGFEASSTEVDGANGGVGDVVFLVRVGLRLQDELHKGRGIDILFSDGGTFLNPLLRINGEAAFGGGLHERFVSEHFTAGFFGVGKA